MNKVVIYPGRFQPMLGHHAEVFSQLQKQFPDAEVYIGTSDKVEPPKSPFNFKEKQQIAAAHGIPANRVIQASRPYHKDEYAKYFNEDNTVIIFAVGEKDLDRFPFNNVDPSTGLDMTVRGEARPKYYQNISTLSRDTQPMSTRGYITLAPTIKLGDEIASASAFRDALQNAPDKQAAKELFTKQFGNYNEQVFNLIYNKITGVNMKEHINLLRKLAGLPVAEAAPVQFSAEADPKTAKFLPASAASARFSMANRFPAGADLNDPEIRKEQFIRALQQSPGALLAEINERLDPKDSNSLAVGQKVNEILQMMDEKDTGLVGLPGSMKNFVLELAANAMKNMELVAGDDSPVEKESVDLSAIRNDYGVNEAIYAADYTATHEESQFGGYRPKVVNNKNNSMMYLSHLSFAEPEDAVRAAEVYLNTYAEQGDKAASDAIMDFSRMLKHRLVKKKDDSVQEAGHNKDEDDDDSWIPSVDDFEQEIAHGYRGRGALKVEGFSSESDQVLAQVGSGELDAYDVMTRPQGPAQQEAAKVIQQMYDEVAIDNGLHPDDDFEQILDIVADQLADEYGDSDADTVEAVNPYAVGMSQAMKSTGDRPPLKKSTIKKGHKIAKAVASSEAVEETASNAISAAMAELRKLAGL